MAKLTDKQERFVQELLKGKTQREAYRIAYPKSLKWKDSAVDETASKLLKNPKVFPRYEELKQRLIKEAEEECIVEAKDVLRELVRIAFSNASDFAKVVTRPMKLRIWDEKLKEYVYEESDKKYEQYVELTDTDELTPSKKAAIASIKNTRHGITVESYDKMKALELIGKTIGLFKDKVEVSTGLSNPFEGLTTEELKKLILDEWKINKVICTNRTC